MLLEEGFEGEKTSDFLPQFPGIEASLLVWRESQVSSPSTPWYPIGYIYYIIIIPASALKVVLVVVCATWKSALYGAAEAPGAFTAQVAGAVVQLL